MATSIDNATHYMLEKSIAEIEYSALSSVHAGKYYPSPVNWEDEVLYFLMLDRFSDGKENNYIDNNNKLVTNGKTPLFTFPDDAYTANRNDWYEEGGKWCGGTLKGLQSKLGYLSRLGITAIWISPIFKQVGKYLNEYTGKTEVNNSYHGYGVQNFLDVDPHFGTRNDLFELVKTAHSMNIRVILDIILNHSGDVFAYKANRYPVKDQYGNQIYFADGTPAMDPRWDGGTYEVKGYRDAEGKPILPFSSFLPQSAWPDGAIWPAELQEPETFSRAGTITNWDYEPEFLGGDFCSLKDIHHGYHATADGIKIIDQFFPSNALKTLCEVYKFWIAYADIDGYRIDTVKHMEIGATRYFASVIHEFAQSIGKENFFLVGEITGGRKRAFDTLEKTGLDAAIGIDDVQEKLEYLAKGYRNPEEYFGLFRNSALIGKESHTWYGRHIVTMFDDHDRVGRSKTRFCGQKDIQWQDKTFSGYHFLIPAFALHICSMGIPCIYYGTEQGFDGNVLSENECRYGPDRVLRECMFGGPFGSLQSQYSHFFNESGRVYKILSEIIKLRKSRIELRRGRQYLRQISGTGKEGEFGYPVMIGGQMRSIIAWSRIFADKEILCAVNTDPVNTLSAVVTVDFSIQKSKQLLKRVYATDTNIAPESVTVLSVNGRSVRLTIPPCGFAAYE